MEHKTQPWLCTAESIYLLPQKLPPQSRLGEGLAESSQVINELLRVGKY